MTDASGRWVILAASGLMIAVVLIMLAQAAGIGPLAWFNSWVAVQGGQLRGTQFSMLGLMLPAAYLLRAAIRRAIAAETRTPKLRRQFLGTALALGIVGMICAAVAAHAYLRYAESTGAAANLEPVIEVSSHEAIAEAAAMRRRVVLTGAEIHQLEVRFGWGSRRASGASTYSGFRPGAIRSDTRAEGVEAPPVAIFIETVGIRRGAGTPIDHLPQQDRIEGYLIEDGLPDYAREVLVREGARIADPHYLFRKGRHGAAPDLQTTAMAVGFNGALLLCFALWLLFKGARMRTEAP